jgi:hypothetical protein
VFFFTYLRRELRRRTRQAVVTAAGLAVGIGLVITVTALSSGVRSARPLRSLTREISLRVLFTIFRNR